MVLGARSPEFEALLQRRQRLGLDGFDELWGGDYHVAPAPHPWHGYLDDELAAALRPLASRAALIGTGPFNLGDAADYRVPDRGLHRVLPSSTFVATAPLVAEILSPDDETWQKLPFYAEHSVGELLIVDPAARTLSWLVLREGTYVEESWSDLLAVTAEVVARAIRWPADSSA